MNSYNGLSFFLLIVFTGCSLFDEDPERQDRIWQILNEDGEVIQDNYAQARSRVHSISPRSAFPSVPYPLFNGW